MDHLFNKSKYTVSAGSTVVNTNTNSNEKSNQNSTKYNARTPSAQQQSSSQYITTSNNLSTINILPNKNQPNLSQQSNINKINLSQQQQQQQQQNNLQDNRNGKSHPSSAIIPNKNKSNEQLQPQPQQPQPQQQVTHRTSNSQQPGNQKNTNNLFNYIIKNETRTGSTSSADEPMFDPEPAKDDIEPLPLNNTIYLDDKSFMIDETDDLDNEVSDINSKNPNRDSYHVVNEVPEGRLSKKSSRGSSQSSVCSNSTRESSNILADFSDSYMTDPASGLADSMSETDSNDQIRDGCKNELLDTLMRKFNVDVNIDDMQLPKSNVNNNRETQILKSDDSKKQRSDLQKKIQLKQMRQNSNLDESENMRNENHRKHMKSNVKVKSLPQRFLCKYLGKTKCHGLWGVRYIRDPVDHLISRAKRLRTLDELPTMELLVSEKGIHVVQKTKCNNQNNNNNNNNNHHHNTKNEKLYRSGLIPISNISYGVQDSKYGKVFSCIVVRERDTKTLCECYAFLCTKNEHTKRMALSLTLAFKEYGKQLQIMETNIKHKIYLDDYKHSKDKHRDSVV